MLRLVRALAEGPGARVLVRHDRRRSSLPRAPAVEAAGGETIEDGIELEWARWSALETILSCLREARCRLDPDRTLILSGQDYPLRPMADIESDLDRSESDAHRGGA